LATTQEPRREPKVALVLGGGAAKGFAHIGVIRVLEQEKIPIHMIVGTSVGSLIGGIYAANPDTFQLEWLAFKIEKNDILDFSIVYSKLGPVQGAKLESFVEQNVKARKIEDTKILFFPYLFKSSLYLICLRRLGFCLVGGYPHRRTTSYPTLILESRSLALLPCLIGVRMSTGSQVFCNRRSQGPQWKKTKISPPTQAYPMLPFVSPPFSEIGNSVCSHGHLSPSHG